MEHLSPQIVAAVSDVPIKAHDSMRSSLEYGSKESDDSIWQFAKHDLDKT
jgi:hypothetical protein